MRPPENIDTPGETTEPSRGFGRMPYAVVAHPAFPTLSPAGVRVIVAIAALIDSTTDAATVSKTRLAELTGMTGRGADRGVRQAEAAGILTVQRAGGRVCNSYSLIGLRPTWAATTPTGGSGLHQSPDRAVEAQPRPAGHGWTPTGESGLARNPDQPCAQPRPAVRATPTGGSDSQISLRVSQKEGPPAPAAAAAPRVAEPEAADPAIAAALAAAGVGLPTRADLARLPGASVAIVERAAAGATGKAGLVVTRVRELAAEAVAHADRQRRVEAQQASQAAADAADRAELRRKREANSLALAAVRAAVGEAEAAAAWTRAKNSANPMMRAYLSEKRPEDCPRDWGQAIDRRRFDETYETELAKLKAADETRLHRQTGT